MLFCPNCDNILNISKNPPKKKNVVNVQVSDNDTENSKSDGEQSDSDMSVNSDDAIKIANNKKTESEQTNEKYEEFVRNIIVNMLNNETISDDLLNEVRLDRLTKSKSFQDLDKKQKNIINGKLSGLIDKIDDSISAYYECTNCAYSKLIEPGSKILTRANAVINSSNNEIVHLDRLINKQYSKILPITRNYICINPKCHTNSKDAKIRKPREAVFYRNGRNLQVWYTCKVCGSYWKGE